MKLDYEAIHPLQPSARRPIVEMLLLAGPTVAQMLSYNLMQFIDTWMLSRLGDDPPTAVSNAGILSFSAISIGVGTLFLVNTLVSQNYGKGSRRACGKFLWQGLWFALFYSLLLLPLLPFAGPMFRMFGHETTLAQYETLYMHIVLSAAILKLAGVALGQFLLAINRPPLVFLATAAGVSVNVLAGWSLIFGRLGAPPLGVVGAAWAQNIGVGVETAVLAVFAMMPAIRRAYNVLDWRMRWEPFKSLLKLGLPSGVQTVAEVLAWSLFLVWVMAGFGNKAMAANTFMMRYMALSFMPAFGLSTAVTSLVGRYIGMGRVDLAEQRTRLGFWVTAAYMLSCGLLFFLGRDVLIAVFTKDPEVRKLGAVLLTFAAVYQFFDAMYILYYGALRGAGDTFVPALATAVLCWSITVGGGHAIAKLWPELGPTGPWIAGTGYGVFLGFFMYLRYRRGGWKSIRIVREVDNAPPAPHYTDALSPLA